MRLMGTLTVLSVVLITLVGETAAQATNATCRTEYAWMKNSRGQSPCLLTAYLNSACLANPTNAYVDAIPEHFHYNPPTRAQVTKCQCSTVFYAAISACAACQGNIDGLVPWSTWTINCTSVGTGTFPGVWPTIIPEGSAIPAWAYLDVVKQDVFNLTLAQQIAEEHQLDTTGVSSTIPITTSTSTSTTAALSQTTSAAAKSTGSSGSKAKQTVIGTVLGAVILVLICVIAMLIIRRGRSRSPPPPMRAVVSPTVEKAGPPAGLRLPLYDPSNPATFPAEPADSSYRSDY